MYFIRIVISFLSVICCSMTFAGPAEILGPRTQFMADKDARPDVAGETKIDGNRKEVLFTRYNDDAFTLESLNWDAEKVSSKSLLKSRFYLGFPVFWNDLSIGCVSEEASSHDDGYGQIVVFGDKESTSILTGVAVKIQNIAIYSRKTFAFAYFGINDGLLVNFVNKEGDINSENIDNIKVFFMCWINNGNTIRILHLTEGKVAVSDFNLSTKTLQKICILPKWDDTYCYCLDQTGEFVYCGTVEKQSAFTLKRFAVQSRQSSVLSKLTGKPKDISADGNLVCALFEEGASLSLRVFDFSDGKSKVFAEKTFINNNN